MLGARSVIGDNTLLIGASVRLTLLIKRNASWMQLPLRFYHFWNTHSGRVCLNSIARVCQRSTACAISSGQEHVDILVTYISTLCFGKFTAISTNAAFLCNDNDNDIPEF